MSVTSLTLVTHEWETEMEGGDNWKPRGAETSPGSKEEKRLWGRNGRYKGECPAPVPRSHRSMNEHQRTFRYTHTTKAQKHTHSLLLCNPFISQIQK